MKKYIILFCLFFAVSLQAQDMKLPPANDNPLFNSFVGTWVSDSYEFMGVKWVDESEFNWILNNQFLEMKVTTKGNNGFTFKSYGILSVDKEGNYKNWAFDEWGVTSVSYYEGKVEGNKLKSSGGSQFMKGTSEMVVEGNITTVIATFTMKDETGKEITQTMNLIYRKK